MPFDIFDKGTATSDLQSQWDSGVIDVAIAGFNRTGVESGCKVTATLTPSAQMNISSGPYEIAGTRIVYAGGTVTSPNMDSTFPTRVIVYLDATGTATAAAGTPAITPHPPAVAVDADNNLLVAVLADVLIAKGTGAPTIVAGDISDRRIPLGAPYPYVPSGEMAATDVASAITEGLNRSAPPVGVYNTHAALDRWADANANLPANIDDDIRVVMIGDSTSLGLLQNYGINDVSGTLYRYFSEWWRGSAYYWSYFSTATNGLVYWTLTGGTEVTTSSWTPTGRYYGLSANAQTMTLNAVTGDSVNFYYLDNGTVTGVTVSIDGGTPAAVTTANLGDFNIKTFGVEISPGGKHTIQIIGPSAGTLAMLGALVVTNAQRGVRWFNLGVPGVKTDDFANPSGRLNMLDIIKPDLVILSLVFNDKGAQTALSTYDANLSTIIRKCKALTKPADVLLWCPPKCQNESGAILQSAYNQRSRDVGIREGAAVVDFMRTWWGATYSAQFIEAASDPHQTALGQAAIAGTLAQVIEPTRGGVKGTQTGYSARRTQRLSLMKAARKKRGTFIQCPQQGGQVDTTTGLTLAASTNIIYYVPFFLLDGGGVGLQVTIQSLVAAVGGTSPGTAVRLALYSDAYDDAQWPGDKYQDANATVDLTGAPGLKGGFASTNNLFTAYNAGLQWIAFGVTSTAWTTAPQVASVSANQMVVRRLAQSFGTCACYTQSAGYSGGALPARAAPDAVSPIAPAFLVNMAST